LEPAPLSLGDVVFDAMTDRLTGVVGLNPLRLETPLECYEVPDFYAHYLAPLRTPSLQVIARQSVGDAARRADLLLDLGVAERALAFLRGRQAGEKLAVRRPTTLKALGQDHDDFVGRGGAQFEQDVPAALAEHPDVRPIGKRSYLLREGPPTLLYQRFLEVPAPSRDGQAFRVDELRKVMPLVTVQDAQQHREFTEQVTCWAINELVRLERLGTARSDVDSRRHEALRARLLSHAAHHVFKKLLQKTYGRLPASLKSGTEDA
jgi:hypothetical protein